MTNLQVGQLFSRWSNVSRLRFDQHVGQLTNLWQWVTLTLTNIWLTFGQDMTMMLVKSSPISTPSNDHDMTNLWPRFDQVFLVWVMSAISPNRKRFNFRIINLKCHVLCLFFSFTGIYDPSYVNTYSYNPCSDYSDTSCTSGDGGSTMVCIRPGPIWVAIA